MNLDNVVRRGFLEEMSFKKKPKEREEPRHLRVVEKRTTGTGSQKTGSAAKELKSVRLHVGAQGQDSIKAVFDTSFRIPRCLCIK